MSDKYSEGDEEAPTASPTGGRSTRRNLLLYDDVLGDNKARWMETLFNNLGYPEHTKIKLRDFVLPGSHNSAAVDMSRSFSVCGGFESNLNIFKDKRNQVAKCQEKSIMDQLKGGIRYLDLRIVDSKNFGGLRYPLHHTYLINDNVRTMEQAMVTIQTFINQHPYEFVVARIKTGDCASKGRGVWKNEFWRIAERIGRNNILVLDKKYLDSATFESLRGKIIFDIDGSHDELYFGGDGISGDIGNHGDPFEIARKIREADYRNARDK